MKRLIALLLFVAPAAFAGDVTLAPAVIMLRGEVGQSTTQTLALTNNTSQTMNFTLAAEDVVIQDGRRTYAPAGKIAGSIAATAVFSRPSVSIAAGHREAVTVTLTIPPDARHRAVVVLFRGTDRIKNGTATMTASLGSLLTFTLSNDAVMHADALVVQPQTTTSNLAVAQTCTNAGHEPIVAKGMLAVLGANGEVAGKSALKPHRLLPGERAELGAEYAAELAPGHYRVLVTYDYEGGALTQSAEVDVR